MFNSLLTKCLNACPNIQINMFVYCIYVYMCVCSLHIYMQWSFLLSMWWGGWDKLTVAHLQVHTPWKLWTVFALLFVVLLFASFFIFAKYIPLNFGIAAGIYGRVLAVHCKYSQTVCFYPAVRLQRPLSWAQLTPRIVYFCILSNIMGRTFI